MLHIVTKMLYTRIRIIALYSYILVKFVWCTFCLRNMYNCINISWKLTDKKKSIWSVTELKTIMKTKTVTPTHPHTPTPTHTHTAYQQVDGAGGFYVCSGLSGSPADPPGRAAPGSHYSSHPVNIYTPSSSHPVNILISILITSY